MIAPPLPCISLAAGLGDEERALQIGVDDLVPERFVHLQRRAHVFDPGIVDQDIQPAQGFGYQLSSRVDFVDRAHIEFERQAFLSGGVDRFQAGIELVELAAANRDIRTEARKPHRKRLADASAGARDQRAPAFQ